MKFLFVGLGSIGRRHLRNLAALGYSEILLYRTHQSTLPDEELDAYAVETSLEKALAWRPDAVIVANPTALHLAVAIPAAAQGCHLLLEKPVAESMQRIAELRAAVQSSGSRVLVGFQFRYHPGLNQLKRLLDEGKIGRPLSVRAHWGEYLPDWHPWEDYRRGYSARADLGGGVVLTLCHPLDYLRWLLGDIVSLWAFTARLSDLEIDVEDTAEIGLRFANGVLGSVHLDYNRRPASHTVEITGSAGVLRWDNDDGAVTCYPSPPIADRTKASGTRDQLANRNYTTYSELILPAPPGFERNHLFLAQMQHFIQVVQGQVEPRCTLEDGIKALELALAVHHSQKTGQLVSW